MRSFDFLGMKGERSSILENNIVHIIFCVLYQRLELCSRAARQWKCTAVQQQQGKGGQAEIEALLEFIYQRHWKESTLRLESAGYGTGCSLASHTNN